MFKALGFGGSAGVMGAIVAVCGLVPTIILQIMTSRPSP
jgi:hypothetical protein